MGEQTQGPFSDCAKGHVAYKPKMGDALMFYDLMPDYRIADGYSTHTGCPVVKGVKWNAVKWIHGKPFRGESTGHFISMVASNLKHNVSSDAARPMAGDEYDRSLHHHAGPLPDPGLCINQHEQCETWASGGECDKNPGYMTGSQSGQGACRLACKACTPCQPEDAACIKGNREKAGYMSIDQAEWPQELRDQ